ncbi:MAG: UDP-N-acetylglucosamine--N-acetylmuramyl-(pentapeptide) pyrophosphoryl-undecaprenol N-acetylglucosamine transferase [Bdellovibrionales bacterium]|jgi:UDP-N-acetylglucosamine--N-acetylmuramyl-(pentapeptide) pyrophosphoryl-undecaprenol N-acetylglucosamine transferase|nr:UDP-N-acetylglucosamine--N-acetylmuramyl-(pentapeptide) pyrophosphoryl-undecaprenol N-acetylglucosamine transferase [Bdellovibrionales bacterium]MBT3525381.1 UDP-N-acetylglucosamine--N-acetylmuramyl-(pentapeptide) pyrophosphoryl-undecaprenol N-acetylglucosamine transferase [Bdellovibrionales bacterium]MBT7670120.1 UDP-N-acetylglucosamine--N-acetylmuramyl-(pentapeptide) pyrophosphoryl-undecaprenol N-acetylglucosamine transferase [Bdellovibrionales bacterium]MBT7765991.1 UDP-N-acetylglucosamine
MGQIVIFTGGGSGGHVMPALTIIRELLADHDVECRYIGGRYGIERQLVSEIEIPYYPIFTGKLRRYFSWENLLDLFKVVLGIIQSVLILSSFSRRNTLIFSTGGFVSLPVVIGGWLTRKEIYIHEQTACAGLANRIAAKFASRVYISFERSKENFPQEKVHFSGYPVRRECFESIPSSLELNGVTLTLTGPPILFITGGGNGSALLNQFVERELALLTEKYIVVHQVGKKFIEQFTPLRSSHYLPVEFIRSEMIELFKMAAVTISRAGAGTVCELMAIGKRSIFIPLKMAQKNEQYFNALEAKELLGSMVVTEDELLDNNLGHLLDQFFAQRDEPNTGKSGALGAQATTYLASAIREREKKRE